MYQFDFDRMEEAFWYGVIPQLPLRLILWRIQCCFNSVRWLSEAYWLPRIRMP